MFHDLSSLLLAVVTLFGERSVFELVLEFFSHLSYKYEMEREMLILYNYIQAGSTPTKCPYEPSFIWYED